jgi:hypothetical protein
MVYLTVSRSIMLPFRYDCSQLYESQPVVEYSYFIANCKLTNNC